jgi:hypothetical protein
MRYDALQLRYETHLHTPRSQLKSKRELTMDPQWGVVMFYLNNADFQAEMIVFDEYSTNIMIPIHAKLSKSTRKVLSPCGSDRSGSALPAGFNAHGIGAACRFARTTLRNAQEHPERVIENSLTIMHRYPQV